MVHPPTATTPKARWSEPKIFLVLLAVVVIAGIIWHATSEGGAEKTHHRLVSQTDYPGTWPLTVDGGILWCDNGALTITINNVGDSYSLNGTAAATGFNKPLDPIWADDPRSPGLKMSIAPLIADAQKLC